MSNLDTISDPGHVLRVLTSLKDTTEAVTSPPPAQTRETFEFSSQDSPETSRDGRPSGPFIPRGEGPSGTTKTPDYRHEKGKGVAPVSPTQPSSPLAHYSQTPGGWTRDSLLSHEPDTSTLGPTIGETSTYRPPHLNEELFVTKTEYTELTESLDEFVKQEIDERLQPLLRALKEMSADLQATAGSQSALVQKVSALSTKLAKLEQTPPSLIRAPDTTVSTRDKRASTLPETPPAYAQQQEHLSPGQKVISDFLTENPTFIQANIYRKVKLTQLSKKLGYTGVIAPVGVKDWSFQVLCQKFNVR